MAEQSINPEILISAIQEYPVLWDKSLYIYKCRNSTANAWNEVCKNINTKFHQMDEMGKHNFIQFAMKKWRNVRDTWMRARKRLAEEKKSGSAEAVVGKSLIYDDQLWFLKKRVGLKSTESTNTTIDQSDQEEALAPTTSVPAICCTIPIPDDHNRNKSQSPKRKKKGDELDGQIMNSSTLNNFRETESKNYYNNRHLSFFKGIIPSLDQFDEEDTLEFQAGVISLLQKIRKRKMVPQPNLRKPFQKQSVAGNLSGPHTTHSYQQQPVFPPRQDYADSYQSSPSPSSTLSDNS